MLELKFSSLILCKAMQNDSAKNNPPGGNPGGGGCGPSHSCGGGRP